MYWILGGSFPSYTTSRHATCRFWLHGELERARVALCLHASFMLAYIVYRLVKTESPFSKSFFLIMGKSFWVEESVVSRTCDDNFCFIEASYLGEVHFAEKSTWIGPGVPKLSCSNRKIFKTIENKRKCIPFSGCVSRSMLLTSDWLR